MDHNTFGCFPSPKLYCQKLKVLTDRSGAFDQTSPSYIDEGTITYESRESIITMQRVLVLDTNKNPLMPTHPAKVRKLLDAGRAAVYRRYPFTIILKEPTDTPIMQHTELKIDPGSKTTGLSIVVLFKRGWVVVWAANLHHRGQTIKLKLDKRRGARRSRRSRKTRYRQPRFLNRTRPKGWFPPSLRSRVDNVSSWTQKLTDLVSLDSLAVETVRFDMQKMDNPGITGVEYQQGTLAGYELKEYLLEKWGRQCVYCDAENVPLEVEHIKAKIKGGSNRASNLTISCKPCNQRKNDQPIEQFLAHDPKRLKRILAQTKAPLKDAAAVNATRYVIGDALKSFGLPVTFWSGGRIKFNRINQGYDKGHWIDAACVGEQGKRIIIPETLTPLEIKAIGRGSRQMCLMNKYGFPRTKPKAFKRVKGFQTGDIARAVVPKGKRAGTHVGAVAIRAKGSFRVGGVDGINWKYCRLIQRADGYSYIQKGDFALTSDAQFPRINPGVSLGEQRYDHRPTPR